MGYTNYWTMSKEKQSAKTRKKMKAFTKAAIELSEAKICGGGGRGKPEVLLKHIWLNGCEEYGEDHETFPFDMTRPGSSEFCKTARKPYDEVVKACLIYAKELGIIQSWRFDGDNEEEEYKVGAALKVAAEKMTELLTTPV